MADKTTSRIQIGAAAYEADREAVPVPNGDGTSLTLYAHKLGFIEMTNVQMGANARGVSRLALLMEASIRDDDGNRFTLDEINDLRQDVAEPLLAAALKINRVAGAGEDAGNV